MKICKDRMFESVSLVLGRINWKVIDNEKILIKKYFKRYLFEFYFKVR